MSNLTTACITCLNITTNSSGMGETCPIKPEWNLEPFWSSSSDPNIATIELCGISDELLRIKVQGFAKQPKMAVVFACYSLLFVLGITANCLIVRALLCDRTLNNKNNVTNQFLLSLTIADVLFILVCAPFEGGIKHSTLLVSVPALCQVADVIEMTTTSASVLNLAAVSLER